MDQVGQVTLYGKLQHLYPALGCLPAFLLLAPCQGLTPCSAVPTCLLGTTLLNKVPSNSPASLAQVSSSVGTSAGLEDTAPFGCSSDMGGLNGRAVLHCQQVFISEEKRKCKPFDLKLSDPTERSHHQGVSLTGDHGIVVLSESQHGLQL